MKALSVAAFAVLASVTQAQMKDGYVGLRVSCPSGPMSCWASVKEAMEFSGFRVISPLDLKTMTAEIRPKMASSNLKNLLKEISILGDFYAVLRFDLSLEGTLTLEKGVWRLRLPDGTCYRLVKPAAANSASILASDGQLRARNDLLSGRVRVGKVSVKGSWRSPFDDKDRLLEVSEISSSSSRVSRP
jgi:hypothetical protein